MPIEFGELPESAKTPGNGRNYQRARFNNEAEELKSRPHAWAKIATRDNKETASALASNIRRGKVASFRDGKYEAATDDCDVWVRYLGPEDKPAEESKEPATAGF